MCFLVSKPPPNPNFAQQPMASILKAGLPQQPTRSAATLPPVRYAAVAAAPTPPIAQPSVPQTPAASTPNQTAPAAPSIPTALAITPSISNDQMSAVTSSPSLTHPSLTSPMLSSAASISATQAEDSMYSAHESPALSEAVPSSVSGLASTSPQHVTVKPCMNPLCLLFVKTYFVH